MSKNFPNKLVINRKKYSSLDTIFTYKNDILQTIHQIQTINVFFYLTELPEEFTSNFGPDQDILYANIIMLARQGGKMLVEKEEREMNQMHVVRTAEDNNVQESFNEMEDREFQKMLDEIKMTMIQFINNMDLHEVYQFVNFFPFLVDHQELRKIVDREQEEAMEYQLQ